MFRRHTSYKTMLAVLYVVIAAEAQSAYISPLKGSTGIHDPSSFVKEGATYYIFGTGSLISRKSSSDRVTWTALSPALASLPWWSAQVPAQTPGDLWAPDISFRNGTYLLYYSVSSFGSNTSAIGLATTTSLASNIWTDHGVVIASASSNNYNCIDPSIVLDIQGTVWMVFGSFLTGIKMVRLDSATGKRSTDTTVFSIASRPGVSSNPIEAPFIFRTDGWYFLFVSWDYCCKGAQSTYNVRFGRSQEITGPYLDKSGKSMLEGGGTLLDTGDSRWKGPGGESVAVDRDTVFLILHAYDADNNGAPTLQIRPLFFDTGWPSLTTTTGSRRGTAHAGADAIPHLTIVKFSGDRFAIPSKYRGKTVEVSFYTLAGSLVLKTLTAASAVRKPELCASSRQSALFVKIKPVSACPH